MARKFYNTPAFGSSTRWSGTSVGGGGVDMREELRKILEGDGPTDPPQGHWVVYRRMNMSVRSAYWDNEEYKEAVGGPPWAYEDEVHLVRYSQVTSGGLVRFFEMEAPPGVIHVNYRIYYMKHDVVPKRSDYIYEVQWSDHSVKPAIGQLVLPDEDKYNINDIYPLRGDNGRIEFYACLCRREPVKI
jgi:hypothetical protein